MWRKYVAEAFRDDIVAIDATTLTPVAGYPLGDGVAPKQLSRSGNTIWFGSTADANDTFAPGGLGSLDLLGSDHTVTTGTQPDALDLGTAPLLAASSGEPGPAGDRRSRQSECGAALRRLDRHARSESQPRRARRGFADRTVAVWADPAGGDQANRQLRSATADANGTVTAAKLSRDTTVSAIFGGDAQTQPLTVKSTVLVHSSVSEALSRQYKTKSSVAYFHKKVNPYVTTTMNAFPGRKQYLTVEY